MRSQKRKIKYKGKNRNGEHTQGDGQKMKTQRPNRKNIWTGIKKVKQSHICEPIYFRIRLSVCQIGAVLLYITRAIYLKSRQIKKIDRPKKIDGPNNR